MSSEISKQRYLFLDLVKVIALIFMPCIHMFGLVCSYGCIDESFPIDSLSLQFSIIYLFVPTAFVFCMGAALVLTKNQTPDAYFKRGLHLLLVGFILNALRGSVYLFYGALFNSELYAEYWYWLWGSDILYFDGLFFILFALFKKLKFKDWQIIIAVLLMLGVSEIIMPLAVENETLIQLLGNIVYINYDSYFPVLSWSIYPITGYLFMKGLKSVENKKKYILLFDLGTLVVFVVSLLVMYLTGTFDSRFLLWGEGDFIMDIPSILLTLPISVIYISIMYFVSNLIKNEKFISLLARLSNNLNMTYVIHWVLVMYFGLLWRLLSKGYLMKYGVTVYILGLVVLVISAILADVINKRKKKIKNKKA